MRGILAAGAALLALGAPATAHAGVVAAPASTDTPSAACTGGCSGSYSVSAPAASAPLQIRPVDGRDRTTGEAGWADFPPADWPHLGAVQGYQVWVDVAGSVVGSNWEAVVCKPGSGGTDVCVGGVKSWRGTGSTVLQFALPSPDQRIRVALKYIGSAAHPSASSIVLNARLTWFEVDTQPPAIKPALGGRPWTGDGTFGLGDDDSMAGKGVALVTDASDNTGLASETLSVDGRDATTPSPDQSSLPDLVVPDGQHALRFTVCDIAFAQNCSTVAGKVTVDSAPPQVKLRTVAGDSATPEIPVPAFDPPVNGFRSGLASARVRIGTSLVDADRRATGDGFVLVPKQPLGEGIYDLSAVVTDAAGNESDTQDDPGDNSPKLVVDMSPPHVAPRLPVPRTRTAGSPPSIVAGVIDSVGAVGGGMEVDGLSVPAQLTLDDNGGQVVEWDPEQPLCAGTHKVRVSVADAVGHPAQARWSFRIAGRLTKACARRLCVNGARAVKSLRRQISFDAGARARALRRHQRKRAARWQRERTEDKRSLRETRRAMRLPCRVARRR